MLKSPAYYSFDLLIGSDYHDDDRMAHLCDEIDTSAGLSDRDKLELYRRLCKLRLTESG